ncbi:efflux RND transporter periplasmic adaptor subunit [Methylophilus sp. 14]|uniref:efflux RND transporter periplasmic adaptor subunit n=1 Tax=Methylophilus sp. 14 TaxID=2781019 RepID=UPI0018909F5C|nr:efflux RND transporter periplasmic adaptor subunit [Methylophilus sp. 14]MBF4988070.1 efflux RND transporter periplasmic adaptor subunit [Methylophilus sp. 14]
MQTQHLWFRATKGILRVGITLAIAVAAGLLAYKLWVRYTDYPWTRDGRVRADVVNIAPDVAGLVTAVPVRDNQYVHQGDVLFRIDTMHYQHALAEATAVAQQRKSVWEMKKQQSARRAHLDDEVISRENREDTDLSAVAAKAEYEAAVAQVEKIKLDLERTVVRSPVDGWVSNLLVRPGDFAQVGAAKLAVIDQHSFWVYGYFEEHKLGMIKVGDAAEVQLLGSHTTLKGHVESIAHGITDRDNPTDIRLLANVNPTFNWVRLAQRIPVRIHLDQMPTELPLVAGMTCSVVISHG